MNKRKKQLKIEKKFSKKYVKQAIQSEIDMDSPVALNCLIALQEYRTYQFEDQEKKTRIDSIDKDNQTIVLALITAIISTDRVQVPIQKIVAELVPILQQDKLEAIQTAAEIILHLSDSGLYEGLHPLDPENKTGQIAIRPLYTVSKECREYINSTLNILPPMVCDPEDWVAHDKGGWLSQKASILCGDPIKHHNEYQCYDVLNILQKIEWELDTNLFDMKERPKQELKEVKAKNNFNNHVHQLYELLPLLQNEKVRFVWAYDNRGRSIIRGDHFNPQGTTCKKARFNFAKKEYITKEIIL